MKKVALAITALSVFTLPGAADAAACRNAQGHFIKCAPAAAAPTAASPHAPAVTPAKVAAPQTHAAAAHAVTPAKVTAPHPASPTHAAAAHAAKSTANGRKAPCRDAKGRFARCAT